MNGKYYGINGSPGQCECGKNQVINEQFEQKSHCSCRPPYPPYIPAPNPSVPYPNLLGLWNADQNSPKLLEGDKQMHGNYYIVDVGGNRFGENFKPGDWCFNEYGVWKRVPQNPAVASVNGQTGEVEINLESLGLVDPATKLIYDKFLPNTGESESGTVGNTIKLCGSWNAQTNTPELDNNVTSIGQMYVVSKDGHQLDQDWKEHDFALNLDGNWMCIRPNSNQDTTNQVLDAMADVPLVQPILDCTWRVFNQSGTDVTAVALGNNYKDPQIKLENGYVARLNVRFKYKTTEGTKNPTKTSGSITNILPADGEWSGVAEYTYTSDGEITQKISAPKAGMMVSGDKIVKANGNDEITMRASVDFCSKVYFGLSDTFPSDQELIIDKLASLDEELSDHFEKQIPNLVTYPDKFYLIAFPKSLGSTIECTYRDGIETPVALTKREFVMTNVAGKQINYTLASIPQGTANGGTLTIKIN